MARRSLRAGGLTLLLAMLFVGVSAVAGTILGTFAPTASMAQDRENHTSTLLPDGRVLIAGGATEPVSGQISSVSTAELFDPSTETFSPAGNLGTARRDHTATLLNDGRVLLAGGRTGGFGAFLASAKIYDPAANTFTPTGSMAVARNNHAAVLLPNGNVLVLGGGTNDSAELYDQIAGSFSPIGSMSTARAGTKAVLLINGKVLVTGGQTASGVLRSAELYDPLSGTFSPTGDMTLTREGHAMTLLPNGRVLVVGGNNEFDGGSVRDSAELYDPVTGVFAATGNMTVPRTGPTTTLLVDGRVLVAGGQSGGVPNDLVTAELYDPATGAFSLTGSMTEPRRQHRATRLSNGDVLVTGGYDGSHTLTGAEVYAPPDDEGPIAEDVLANPNPVAVDTEVSLTALIDDSNTGGSAVATAEFSIDGGSFVAMIAQDGAFDEVAEDVEASIGPFAQAGVLDVCVRGTDIAGNTGSSVCIFLAAYDPDGGFVTGGGWIDSPTGACQLTVECQDETGKANFGFVSKYKKGATVPVGETEFQFQAGDLNFHSTSYDWLVVAGHRAQYKGDGTINGAGNYGLLTAIDEKLSPSTDVDLFRIKIWDPDIGDAVVYDNQMDTEDDADPATTIGGGNIVIHKSKKKEEPASTKIAFFSDRDSGDREIYLMNADGSGQTNLTSSPGRDQSPSISPDGAKIAFESQRGGIPDEIYVMNIDGPGVTRLTFNGADESSASWCANNRIVFASIRDGQWEIYIMDSDGLNQTRLTFTGAHETTVACSFDGTRIAFDSARDGDTEIYVMDADGQGQTRLTDRPGNNSTPEWSPDGSMISWGCEVPGSLDICVMNADGTGQVNITGGTFFDSAPAAWSPDGTKLAFHSFDRDGDVEIYTMNPDGSDVQRITDSPGVDGGASWGPGQ